jgi:hypothetical protein
MSLENYITEQSRYYKNIINIIFINNNNSRGLKSITEQILLSDEYQELKGSKTNNI